MKQLPALRVEHAEYGKGWMHQEFDSGDRGPSMWYFCTFESGTYAFVQRRELVL
jgi:hypothetical protein